MADVKDVDDALSFVEFVDDSIDVRLFTEKKLAILFAFGGHRAAFWESIQTVNYVDECIEPFKCFGASARTN